MIVDQNFLKLFIYPRNTILIKVHYTPKRYEWIHHKAMNYCVKSHMRNIIDAKRYKHGGDMVPIFKEYTCSLVEMKMQVLTTGLGTVIGV